MDTIELTGVNQINKSEITYFGKIEDNSIGDDVRFKSYFYNDAGLIDSIVESSIDTNGRNIYLSRYNFTRYGYKDWLKMEFSNPYCIWNSISSWGKCDSHYSLYKILDDSIPNIFPDLNELDRLNHTYIFSIYKDDYILKDSIIKIDSTGVKNFTTRVYERNSNHSIIRYYSYNPQNKTTNIYDEYTFEYNEYGNKTHKYRMKNNRKTLVHIWRYNTNQNIIYEEVEKSKFGIKNRRYFYDKYERLQKIKDTHYGSGRFHFTFNYLDDGFTIEEKCKLIHGMTTIHTVKYQFR